MAREDARWFATAVVALALVLFMALPLTVLIAIDHLENKAKTKAEIRREINELKRLKEEVRKEVQDVANRRGNRSEPNQ